MGLQSHLFCQLYKISCKAKESRARKRKLINLQQRINSYKAYWRCLKKPKQINHPIIVTDIRCLRVQLRCGKTSRILRNWNLILGKAINCSKILEINHQLTTEPLRYQRRPIHPLKFINFHSHLYHNRGKAQNLPQIILTCFKLKGPLQVIIINLKRLPPYEDQQF